MRYLRYITPLLCVLGVSSQMSAYSISFSNKTPFYVQFYELTTSANLATPQNFASYITPGTTQKTINANSTYSFATRSATRSIYMLVSQLSTSIPIKFGVSSFNSGALVISSVDSQIDLGGGIAQASVLITVKKGSTSIATANIPQPAMQMRTVINQF